MVNSEFGAQRFPVPHDPSPDFPSACYVSEVPESLREALFRTEPRYMTATAEEMREVRGWVGAGGRRVFPQDRERDGCANSRKQGARASAIYLCTTAGLRQGATVYDGMRRT